MQENNLSEKINLPTLKASFAGLTTKRELKKSKCILPISLGQQYHEGDKMIATLYDINQEVGECDVVICDTLYEHTKKIGCRPIEPEIIRQECLEEGKAWESRNQQAIEQLTIPHRILHWDEWQNQQKFIDKKKLIDSLCENDKGFKKALNKTASEFLTHYIAKNSETQYETASFQFCVDYLKEECAVMLLWAECDYHFLAYPVKCTDVLSSLYKNTLQESNPGKLEYLVIKFQARTMQKHLNGQSEKSDKKNLVPADAPNIQSIIGNPYSFHYNNVTTEKLSAISYGTTAAILASPLSFKEKTELLTSFSSSIYKLAFTDNVTVDDPSPNSLINMENKA